MASGGCAILRRQLPKNVSQHVTHGLGGVGVVRVRRRTMSIEMRAFIHSLTPFGVGLPNEFCQKLIGTE